MFERVCGFPCIACISVLFIVDPSRRNARLQRAYHSCFFYQSMVCYPLSGIRWKPHQVNLYCHYFISKWGDNMKIGIIGAGKVGCSMGKYMVQKGLNLAGYYSRSKESSEFAGTFTDSNVYEQLNDMIEDCDCIFVATTDRSLEDVWRQILDTGVPLTNKIFCHFSGSFSSDVFSGVEATGASACSIHPMAAFSDKSTSYQQLNQVMFTLEGKDPARSRILELFQGMGNAVLTISSEKKTLYHCSASLVSNFVIGLYQMGLDILGECGIKQEDATALVETLVRNNVEAMLQNGPENALTGPIERGDAITIEKHLAALSGRDRERYLLLGEKVLEVAERKNPARDYEDIRRMYEEYSNDISGSERSR